MKPHSPSVDIKKSILRSVWWPAHWSAAGTMRFFICRTSRSKPRKFSSKKLAWPLPSRRRKCWLSPETCRGYGMLAPPTPRTASECCGCSSRTSPLKSPSPSKLLVHIRWQGGACTHHSVPLPPSIADRMRYPAPLVDRVRNLAQSLLDAQIVNRLNQEGLVSALGKPFTLSMIRWIRHRYKIPAAKLMSSEESTVQQVAERFRVSIYVVYSWIEQGLLPARRLNPGMPYWITVREVDEQKLRDWVSNSHRLRTTS